MIFTDKPRWTPGPRAQTASAEERPSLPHSQKTSFSELSGMRRDLAMMRNHYRLLQADCDELERLIDELAKEALETCEALTA